MYFTMQSGESLYAEGCMPYGSESRKPIVHVLDREGATLAPGASSGESTKSLKEEKTFWGKEFRLRD